ncbi:hypothetical protein OPV22_000277 [Ensete ventricosum]|uniref:Uncharacterized protein n=1 Tax=Ensete ventricosum TaxID=4639 RepID=A0AAV8RSY3_ENSVE|nr:hypothetical protein OPV22_000277 [Ensete ventricosum]
MLIHRCSTGVYKKPLRIAALPSFVVWIGESVANAPVEASPSGRTRRRGIPSFRPVASLPLCSRSFAPARGSNRAAPISPVQFIRICSLILTLMERDSWWFKFIRICSCILITRALDMRAKALHIRVYCSSPG